MAYASTAPAASTSHAIRIAGIIALVLSALVLHVAFRPATQCVARCPTVAVVQHSTGLRAGVQPAAGSSQGPGPVDAANTAIFRAVTGGIDAPPHGNLPNLFDYYGNITNPLPFPRQDMSARLRSKYFKMCEHMLHPNYTAFIWADGAFTLKPGLVEWLLGHMGNADAAFISHPYRSTTTQEIEYMYSKMMTDAYLKVRYSAEPMREQVQAYLQDGFPEAAPLIGAGLFIRRNTDKVNRAMEHWYIENTKWSIQDQLSLPFIIWKHDLTINYIPGSFLFRGPFHEYRGHSQLQ